MPTYQYRCTACSEPLEAVQSFTDPPLVDCPVCGGILRKVFSTVGVVFKGSGWYKTDSRAAASSDKPEKKVPEAATTAEKSGGAATETKSAKEAVSEATTKTTAEIKKTADKPATPAAAS